MPVPDGLNTTVLRARQARIKLVSRTTRYGFVLNYHNFRSLEVRKKFGTEKTRGIRTPLLTQMNAFKQTFMRMGFECTPTNLH